MKKVIMVVLAVILCFSTVYAEEAKNVTREDFCTQLYSVINRTGCFAGVEIAESFDDCDAKAVNLMKNMGIVKGVGNGMFNPKSDITREEAAVILAKFCAYFSLPVTLSEYEYLDHSDISDWAKESVYVAYHAGVLQGTGDGNFYPKEAFEDDMTDVCSKRIYEMYTGEKYPSVTFEDKIYFSQPTEENFMVSPFSIKAAMMMAANGADGETQRQILDVLGVNDINEYNKTIKERIATYSSTDALVLNVANSIWFNTESNISSNGFETAYSKKMDEFFGAKSETVNNANAVETINSWVKEKTGEKIPTIIDNNEFVSVLLNAVYFKGGWENEFKEVSTYEDVFKNADSTESLRDFMTQTAHFGYYEDNNVKILEMPYKNFNDDTKERADFDASMYIVLSDNPITTPASDIQNAQFSSKKVHVTMPKFKAEYSVKLSEQLKQMGIIDAFDGNFANFKPMIDSDNLCIDEVLHKTYIDVDEFGTEAAAATAVVVKATSARPVEEEIIEFKVDKPFTYVIKDNTNGEILFAGRIANLK